MDADGQHAAHESAPPVRPLHELIDAWRDGSIDTVGALALVAMLEGDPAVAAALRARIAFEGQLAQALDPAGGDAVVRGVLERIRAEESAQRFTRDFRRGPFARHLSSRRRAAAARRPWAGALAVAALLALAAGMWWWRQPSPVDAAWATRPERVVLAVTSGQVALAGGVVSGPGEHVLGSDASLAVAAGTRAVLRWPDGSRLDPEAGAALRLRDGGQGRLDAILERGAVVAAVARRAAGQRFRIDTPQARIDVLGTRFRLSAGDDATDLAVDEGAVRFANRGAGDAETVVNAGESAAAGSVFHVDPRGVDAPGGGSGAAPWATLAYALTQVPGGRGHTIRLAAGDHVLARPATIPPGVNLIGVGREACRITGEGEGFLLRCGDAAPAVDGMQTIAGFTIDGRLGAIQGGLRVLRHRVTVRDLGVVATRETGIRIDGGRPAGAATSAPDTWLRGIRVLECRFRDCTRRGSNWDSTGALTIGALDGAEIAGLDIDERGGSGRPGRTGFGIMHSNGGWFRGLVVRDCTIRLMHEHSNSDMAIFLRDCHAGSEVVRIRTNTTLRFENTVDGDAPVALTVRDCRIEHPDVRRDDVLLGSIWLSLSHARCHGNWIENPSWLGAVVLWPVRDIEDLDVRNNVVSGNGATGALVTIAPRSGRVADVRVLNNTVERTHHVLALRPNLPARISGVRCANNLVIGTSGPFLLVGDPLRAEGLEISGNLVWQCEPPTGHARNRTADPLLERAGAKPFPWYRPSVGSPAIDAGVDVGLPYRGRAPDIGAWETGAP